MIPLPATQPFLTITEAEVTQSLKFNYTFSTNRRNPLQPRINPSLKPTANTHTHTGDAPLPIRHKQNMADDDTADGLITAAFASGEVYFQQWRRRLRRQSLLYIAGVAHSRFACAGDSACS